MRVASLVPTPGSAVSCSTLAVLMLTLAVGAGLPSAIAVPDTSRAAIARASPVATKRRSVMGLLLERSVVSATRAARRSPGVKRRGLADRLPTRPGASRRPVCRLSLPATGRRAAARRQPSGARPMPHGRAGHEEADERGVTRIAWRAKDDRDRQRALTPGATMAATRCNAAASRASSAADGPRRVHSRVKRFSQPSTSVSRSGLSPRVAAAPLRGWGFASRSSAFHSCARSTCAPARSRVGVERLVGGHDHQLARPLRGVHDLADHRVGVAAGSGKAEGHGGRAAARPARDGRGRRRRRARRGRPSPDRRTRRRLTTSARPSPGMAGPPHEPSRLLPSIR